MNDQPFGFRVEVPETVEFPGYSHTYGWRVHLPHQCSTWDIVGGDSWVDTAEQAEAVAELERFIAEAQEALAAVREGRNFDAEEQS